MNNAHLTVEITRGFAVESRHLVHAVIMDGRGQLKAVYGDPKRLTFPRSILKPLQAIALVETKAAAMFQVSDAELALACASHSGEDRHVNAVAAWLARLGLDGAALECGSHATSVVSTKDATPLHNNCSGKHTGMLTLALFLKASPDGYTKTDHPVQRLILSTLSDMCGENLTPACCGIDGCSAPNPAMALDDLARGFARFMCPEILGLARGAACRQVFQAMVEHPDLIGGTGRLDTVLMQAAGGKILSKTGAEGVYLALIPEKDAVIVLKAEDGATRAAQAALHGLLEKHQLADRSVLDAITPLTLPVLKNWRGFDVGRIRVG